MSMTNPPPLKDPIFGELTLHWKWMLGLGILMAVLGLIGLGMTYALTILSVLWFGVLAVIAGVAQLFDAFKCSGWKSILSHVLLGLLYLAAGVVLIALPVQSAWWLTLLLGITFVVTGILRLIMAFQIKASTMVAVTVAIAGAISVLLGVMIYGLVDLPDAASFATEEGAKTWFMQWGWVIGLFVALEFIVHGASLIALAFAAKNASDDGTPPSGGNATPAA